MFLSASGILSPDAKAVCDAIGAYAKTNGGTFEPREGTTNNRNIGVIRSTESTTTVLYPDEFTHWDDLSKFLSSQLKKPVFSFHIHDGDLWMFVAFDDGQDVARFNPVPDYWEEIDDAERDRWEGNAGSVASLVPGLAPASVERYFGPWTGEVLAAQQKSYVDDQFEIGVDWQLTDFMRRLGFAYPLDDSGNPIGETFYLKIRRQRASKGTIIPTPQPQVPPKPLLTKPWWKFW